MKTIDEILSDVEKDKSRAPEWCYQMTYSHEPYYTFLHKLVKRANSKLVVELGTDKGTSAVFMATATDAIVISIDIDSESLNNLSVVVKDHGLNNLITYLGSSTDQSTIDMIKEYGTIDLLFIDTLHTFEQASKEYNLYKPLLSLNALVCHDDTNLDDEMRRYWASIPEPKVETQYHYTGFGISK